MQERGRKAKVLMGDGRCRWTELEDTFLKANYGRLSAQQCASQLVGRSRNSVAGRADRLGLTQKGSPGRLRLSVENVPHHRHRNNCAVMMQLAPYQEPPMPQVNDAEKLHSRAYKDLEPGMCNWPVYVEQGVQMYCAAATERLPGRYDIYCACHKAMGSCPPKPRQSKGT